MPDTLDTQKYVPMPDTLDTQKYVNSVCVDLLLQEIVPTSVRVSQTLADAQRTRAEGQTRLDTPLLLIPGDTAGAVAVFESPLLQSDDVALRVDACGFDLGLRLTEVLMYKAPAALKIVDILDIMKFICRDAWKCLRGKQMSNLRTNHRGIFVLIDNNYELVAGFNSAKGAADSVMKARTYAHFPCGVIRGILLSFGLEAYVSADISQFPAITFNIQTSINN